MRNSRKELEKLRQLHAAHLLLAEGEPGRQAKAHRIRAEELRTQLLALYAVRDLARPAPAVAEARNKRWSHYGAMGSIAWALAGVRRVQRLETASGQAKAQATAMAEGLEKLLELLKERKPLDGNSI